MIPESTQEPHEENGLGLGTSVRLSDCVTVSHFPGISGKL